MATTRIKTNMGDQPQDVVTEAGAATNSHTFEFTYDDADLNPRDTKKQAILALERIINFIKKTSSTGTA